MIGKLPARAHLLLFSAPPQATGKEGVYRERSKPKFSLSCGSFS
jgi:hypothetical protein